jgi:hypothetical protein
VLTRLHVTDVAQSFDPCSANRCSNYRRATPARTVVMLRWYTEHDPCDLRLCAACVRAYRCCVPSCWASRQGQGPHAVQRIWPCHLLAHHLQYCWLHCHGGHQLGQLPGRAHHGAEKHSNVGCQHAGASPCATVGRALFAHCDEVALSAMPWQQVFLLPGVQSPLLACVCGRRCRLWLCCV